MIKRQKDAEHWLKLGYLFDHDGRCPACDAIVSYWNPPVGKKLIMLNADFDSHFASCPKAKEFRMFGVFAG